MNATLKSLIDRLDALAPKERVLLVLAAILVIGLLWTKLFFDPLSAERRRLSNKIADVTSRTRAAQALAVEIVEAAAQDPNKPVRAQLADTAAKIEQARNDIRDVVGELIPPRDIPQILRRVLEQSQGLEFVGLQGLGAEALRENDAEQAPGDEEFIAYRHGFQISFEGSYLATLAYLQALEALPWRLFWESVQIEIEEHPTARVSVTVYTLSLDRSWIGV